MTQKLKNLGTYDCSSLDTSIPHDKLKTQLFWVIEKAFKGMNKMYIKINKFCSRWSTKKEVNKPNTTFVDLETLQKMIVWFIDNTYVRIGDQVFEQVIGTSMETDCAPFLANLLLFFDEFQWMNEQLKEIIF